MKLTPLFCITTLPTLGLTMASQHALARDRNPKSVSNASMGLISGYEHDSYYEAKTRKNLASFHRNFSHQKFAENAPLTNPSIAWDQDTSLTIGTDSFVKGIQGFGEVFSGLILADVYRIIDGDSGSILFRAQGKQGGEFMGIKPEGRDVDFFQAEFMVFDRNSLLEDLQTTSSLDIAVKQLLGQLPAGKPNKDDLDHLLVENPQTPLAFRNKAKKAVTEIHENYNLGHNAANRDLVAPNVIVSIQTHEEHKGPEAFSDLIAHHTKSFSGLLYHDYGIVADGRLAAVHWVWEGKHDGDYNAPNGTVIPATGRTVRNRGYYFYEFGLCSGLINKVTAVWDELSIEGQINGGPLAT